MNNLGISVIVTSHDYGVYLSQCIDSILNQVLLPSEIIIINDSSVDDTTQIVKKYENNDLIKYFEVDFANVQKTRNFGLSKVSEKSVLFVDADDYLRSDFLEKTAKVLKEKPDIDLVYTDHLDIDKNGNKLGRSYSEKFDYNLLKRRNYIGICSLIKNKDHIIFDERIKRFQDWDVWLRYLSGGKAFYLQEPLSIKREHGDSITANNETYLEKLKVFCKNSILDCSICDINNLSLNKVERNNILIASIGQRGHFEKKEGYYFLKARSFDEIFQTIRTNFFRLGKVEYFMISAADVVHNIKNDKECLVVSQKNDILDLEDWSDIDSIVFSCSGIERFLNPSTSKNIFIKVKRYIRNMICRVF